MEVLVLIAEKLLLLILAMSLLLILIAALLPVPWVVSKLSIWMFWKGADQLLSESESQTNREEGSECHVEAMD